ncbi:alpha/beta fold hydrolase [Patulibacter sp. NPDC049589]|uniref:alpha/beta fold hydrolase n=1 Tax=Patulibacter sp. NPDC049589 TaxID=3154731 RepID=UPI003416205F
MAVRTRRAPNPTASAPDLPGFWRSGRPDVADFDLTVDAYVRWFGELVDALGLTSYRLVVHDFGSVALAAAALRPEQVRSVVAIDVVPLSASARSTPASWTASAATSTAAPSGRSCASTAPRTPRCSEGTARPWGRCAARRS